MVANVVFRKWMKPNQGVIALFPDIPADIYGRYCDSYEHVGQHGAADYHGIIRQSAPAGGKELAELRKELNRIGYRLKPMQRASWKQHQRRRSSATKFRSDIRSK